MKMNSYRLYFCALETGEVTSNYNATFIKPSISYKKVTGVIRCKVTVQMSLSVALFKKR